MDMIKPLFTATATAEGGRNGQTQASDGSVGADLSVPKAMGGPRKSNTKMDCRRIPCQRNLAGRPR